MNRLRLLSIAAFFLVSCASPSQQLPSVVPGKLFEGGYIDVRAPQSEGWQLAESSSRGMGFRKPGVASGESFGAQVLFFELPPAQTPEQFVELMKEGMRKDTDPVRFDVIESSTTYTEEREYPCARHHGVLNDKQARTSPTTKEQLVLEMYSLYCRHPLRTNTGFAAIYSYRGRGRYPALDKEAQDFIKGVQVPAAKS
jgi:hypothetical protein